MIAREPTRNLVEAARNVLRGRERLPDDPAEWGRAWGFHHSVSARLVREIDAERRRNLRTSPPKGAKHHG